jgi:hypothetical protein
MGSSHEALVYARIGQAVNIAAVRCSCGTCCGGVCAYATQAAVTISAFVVHLSASSSRATPTAAWLAGIGIGPGTSFKCGEATVSVTCSAIAPITAIDKMATTAKATCKAAKGVQAPEQLLGQPKDTLTLRCRVSPKNRWASPPKRQLPTKNPWRSKHASAERVDGDAGRYRQRCVRPSRTAIVWAAARFRCPNPAGSRRIPPYPRGRAGAAIPRKRRN